MLIRSATETDIFKVSRLWENMAREISPKNDINPNLWRKVALNLLKDINYTLIVAEDNGILAGFVDYILVDDPSINGKVAVYRHWYVERQYRGSELASNMWKYCLDHEKGKGATHARFLTAEKQLEMWKSHGYKIVQYVMEREI